MVDLKNHWSYDLLKQLAIEEGQKSITTPREMEQLKSIYAIDSQRRKTCIETVAELVDFLERSDALNEYDISPLEELADHQCSERLQCAVNEYKPPVLPLSNQRQNQYGAERLADQMKNLHLNNHVQDVSHTAVNPTKSGPSPTMSSIASTLSAQQRASINKMLAKHLGTYWRRLGRALGICEGDMDGIELRHPRDLQSCIYSLLGHFEHDDEHAAKDEVLLLCRALDTAHRKDLRRKVEEILRHQ